MMGDGDDSIMAANANNLIYAWIRNGDDDVSYTINFRGINHATADIHDYFEAGGITDHSEDGDTRYTTFFTPITTFEGNATFSELINLDVSTLPTCSSLVNGSIGRNHSGVYGCDASEVWQKLF